MNQQQIMQLALQALKGVPSDVVKSTQAAVNISPPMDLMRRLQTNKAYLPYGGVPQSVNQDQSIQNIKNAVQASHLFGYAGAVRPFASNPLELSAGESAKRLATGKGWELFDKVLQR